MIAITAPKRAPNMPEIPTVAETYPGYDVVGTNALFAPAKTPPEIISRLTSEVQKVLAMPRVQQLILDGAGLPAHGDSQEVVKWMEVHTKLWRNVMEKTGAVLE
jgi:tripartite-type tricarboxylate transporter receptor subunit TctC